MEALNAMRRYLTVMREVLLVVGPWQHGIPMKKAQGICLGLLRNKHQLIERIGLRSRSSSGLGLRSTVVAYHGLSKLHL